MTTINRRNLVLGGFGFATALAIPKILDNFGQLPVNYISPEANRFSNILLFGADPTGQMCSSRAFELAGQAGIKHGTPLIVNDGIFSFNRKLIITNAYPKIIINASKILMAEGFRFEGFTKGVVLTNNYFVYGPDMPGSFKPDSKPIYLPPDRIPFTI